MAALCRRSSLYDGKSEEHFSQFQRLERRYLKCDSRLGTRTVKRGLSCRQLYFLRNEKLFQTRKGLRPLHRQRRRAIVLLHPHRAAPVDPRVFKAVGQSFAERPELCYCAGVKLFAQFLQILFWLCPDKVERCADHWQSSLITWG